MNSTAADSQIDVLVGLVVALVLLTGIGLVFLQDRFGDRARLRRRVALIGGQGSGTTGTKDAKSASSGPRRKAIQSKLKEIEDKRKKNKPESSLKNDLLQADLSLSVKQFIIYSGCFGIACALLALMVFRLPPISGVLMLVIGGIGLPRFTIRFLIKRRVNLFTANFATAIDIIVRGIRTGLPVGECLNIIGREMPDPVAQEFRAITEGQRLGMTLEDVLDRAVKRMPTPELKFFAIVLTIQKQTGGNLADTLEKLSDVLRERRKMRAKVQALSSEAKSSAMIIGSLPFAVGGMLFLVNPDYVKLLFTTHTGNVLITGGAVWMLIGVLVMKKMINFEI